VTDRLAALRGLLADREIDAALISAATDKRYFSGFILGRGEESTSGYAGTLLVTATERILLADSRYTEQASNESPGWTVVLTTRGLEVELPPLLAEHGIERLGMQAGSVSHATWSALAAAAPGVELHDLDDELVALRLFKAPDEVDAIARACSLTDECFAHLLEFVRPGMTELDVAWELERFFRDHGAEGLAFDPLVLAGPRAAMPHGKPSSATIEPGNVLLIDFGCQVDGYRSDMTRTVFIGDPPGELGRLYDVVREAQAQAIDALAPGAIGSAIDAIAREHIAATGAQPYGHGLGHGIGLDTHEAPRLRRSSDDELQPGMVFSIEPGIYQPGVTGIRIEDIVALTESGPRMLTSSPREILVLG
jgi:Xaa-Pro aminopeptidase